MKRIGIKSDGVAYKVLIVDDSPLVHRMIKKAIEPLGFNVIATAKNGKDGVDLYKEHTPDLVTMDITMPIMDGVEAAGNIIKENPEAKILMLSAMGDDDIKKEAKDKGVTNFITKPFKPNDLIKNIVYTLKIKLS